MTMRLYRPAGTQMFYARSLETGQEAIIATTPLVRAAQRPAS